MPDDGSLRFVQPPAVQTTENTDNTHAERTEAPKPSAGDLEAVLELAVEAESVMVARLGRGPKTTRFRVG